MRVGLRPVTLAVAEQARERRLLAGRGEPDRRLEAFDVRAGDAQVESVRADVGDRSAVLPDIGEARCVVRRDAVDAATDAECAKQPLNVLQESLAVTAEADVTIGLAVLDSRYAAIRAIEAAEECGLDIHRSGEYRGWDVLARRPIGRHADPAEELAYRFAADAELVGVIVHLDARDSSNELGEEALVGREQAIADVLLAVDPGGGVLGQRAVPDQVPGQLREPLGPAVRQLAIDRRGTVALPRDRQPLDLDRKPP